MPPIPGLVLLVRMGLASYHAGIKKNRSLADRVEACDT